jgi:hypothetical protein
MKIMADLDKDTLRPQWFAKRRRVCIISVQLCCGFKNLFSRKQTTNLTLDWSNFIKVIYMYMIFEPLSTDCLAHQIRVSPFWGALTTVCLSLTLLPTSPSSPNRLKSPTNPAESCLNHVSKSLGARVTRWVCERIAQDVAQPFFLSKLIPT